MPLRSLLWTVFRWCGEDFLSESGHCPCQVPDGRKAVVTKHIRLSCLFSAARMRRKDFCWLLLVACGQELCSSASWARAHAGRMANALVARAVHTSCWLCWKLDGLTKPLTVFLGSDKSGWHVQQGPKHDLINLRVLQIFVLLLKAAHWKHGSRRGPYLRWFSRSVLGTLT